MPILHDNPSEKGDIVKIDNYAVALNSHYYNLSMNSTEVKLSHSTEEFANEESSQVDKIAISSKNDNRASLELSRELSKGVLKNLSGDSQRLIGDRVEIKHTAVEAEGLNFQARALIQADGKEMEVSLDVSLARSFVQTTSMTRDLVQKKMQDPLVISLDGKMPSLSDKTFSFDIDSNGTKEQISQLKNGNAFLALDKNNNNIIDNGNELFGTLSGNGFADLSAYDDDKNDWIDENDAIFDKLRVWQKSEGKDKLLALGEVGIGAIFLGNAQTPFTLKSDSNETLGEIKSSGMVLFENGSAGVISQVDFAIDKETKKSLEILDKSTQNISASRLARTYELPEKEEENSTDTKMEKLQGQIKELEKELRNADESQKASIQTQIGALFSQMMSMLEQELK